MLRILSQIADKCRNEYIFESERSVRSSGRLGPFVHLRYLLMTRITRLREQVLRPETCHDSAREESRGMPEVVLASESNQDKRGIV